MLFNPLLFAQAVKDLEGTVPSFASGVKLLPLALDKVRGQECSMGWSLQQAGHRSLLAGRLELLIPDCSSQHFLTRQLLLGSITGFCSHLLAQMCSFQCGRERQRQNQKGRFSSFAHAQGAEPISVCCLQQPSLRRCFWKRAEEALSFHRATSRCL